MRYPCLAVHGDIYLHIHLLSNTPAVRGPKVTKSEEVLILILQQAADLNSKAMILQSYISECGPLSEEAGAKVRELLKGRKP